MAKSNHRAVPYIVATGDTVCATHAWQLRAGGYNVALSRGAMALLAFQVTCAGVPTRYSRSESRGLKKEQAVAKDGGCPVVGDKPKDRHG